MLNLILSGVFVSLVTEILKKKNKFDKAMTLWTLVVLSVVISLLAHWILGFFFWVSMGWILVFAGAFYAYVLRNVTAPASVAVSKKKK